MSMSDWIGLRIAATGRCSPESSWRASTRLSTTASAPRPSGGRDLLVARRSRCAPACPRAPTVARQRDVQPSIADGERPPRIDAELANRTIHQRRVPACGSRRRMAYAAHACRPDGADNSNTRRCCAPPAASSVGDVRDGRSSTTASVKNPRATPDWLRDHDDRHAGAVQGADRVDASTDTARRARGDRGSRLPRSACRRDRETPPARHRPSSHRRRARASTLMPACSDGSSGHSRSMQGRHQTSVCQDDRAPGRRAAASRARWSDRTSR